MRGNFVTGFTCNMGKVASQDCSEVVQRLVRISKLHLKLGCALPYAARARPFIVGVDRNRG